MISRVCPTDDLAADFDERPGAGLGSQIGGADHRRGHRARMLGGIGGAAAAAGAAATQARTPAAWKFAGIDAAMLTLRATRSRKPARSISISVRLVSSSSSASSRIKRAVVAGELGG